MIIALRNLPQIAQTSQPLAEALLNLADSVRAGFLKEHDHTGAHTTINVEAVVVPTPTDALPTPSLMIGRYRMTAVLGAESPQQPPYTYDLVMQERETDQPGATYTTRGQWRHGGQFGAFRGLRLGEIISPSALGAGNTNNWIPLDATTGTGVGNAVMIMVTTNAGGSNLTGLDVSSLGAEAHGLVVYLRKIAGGAFTIDHESGFSSAANRFQCPGSVAYNLATNAAVGWMYCYPILRWICLDS